MAHAETTLYTVILLIRLALFVQNVAYALLSDPHLYQVLSS